MRILIILLIALLSGCSPNFKQSRGERITIITDSMRNTRIFIKHKGTIKVHLEDIDSTYLWNQK